MRISKYIHACLLVEKGADKILFDPGKFSFIEGLVSKEHDRACLANHGSVEYGTGSRGICGPDSTKTNHSYPRWLCKGFLSADAL